MVPQMIDGSTHSDLLEGFALGGGDGYAVQFDDYSGLSYHKNNYNGAFQVLDSSIPQRYGHIENGPKTNFALPLDEVEGA